MIVSARTDPTPSRGLIALLSAVEPGKTAAIAWMSEEDEHEAARMLRDDDAHILHERMRLNQRYWGQVRESCEALGTSVAWLTNAGDYGDYLNASRMMPDIPHPDVHDGQAVADYAIKTGMQQGRIDDACYARSLHRLKGALQTQDIPLVVASPLLAHDIAYRQGLSLQKEVQRQVISSEVDLEIAREARITERRALLAQTGHISKERILYTGVLNVFNPLASYIELFRQDENIGVHTLDRDGMASSDAEGDGDISVSLTLTDMTVPGASQHYRIELRPLDASGLYQGTLSWTEQPAPPDYALRALGIEESIDTRNMFHEPVIFGIGERSVRELAEQYHSGAWMR